MLVKTRKAKVSARGVYVQDKELLQTEFKVGGFFEYETEDKKITVRPSGVKGKHTISKRDMGTYIKPVIDIRGKGVLCVLEGCQELEVNIYTDKIVVVGIAEKEEK